MYTKGQWAAITTPQGVTSVIDEKKRELADINCLYDGIDNAAREIEHKANARLIAAAPDLLEACKWAAKLIETARQYFPKSIKNSDKFALENANATILKAVQKAESEA